MGTVYFDGIKTNGLSIASALGESRYYIVDISGRHCVTIHLTGNVHTRGGISIHVALRKNTAFAHATHVPELRSDFASLRVNRLDNAFPAR